MAFIASSFSSYALSEGISSIKNFMASGSSVIGDKMASLTSAQQAVWNLGGSMVMGVSEIIIGAALALGAIKLVSVFKNSMEEDEGDRMRLLGSTFRQGERIARASPEEETSYYSFAQAFRRSEKRTLVGVR